MNTELKFATIIALVAAVITAGTVLTIDDASAKSNKAFGKCVSNAAKTNTSKLVCNALKRGHKFTEHPAENETS
jgi:hypothetical protein